MALLNRQTSDQATVPEEIQEYYQSEKRERTGVAWLLAVGTLLVTVVLAAGIFFSGRWAYRKIAKDDNNGQVAQQQTGQEQQPAPGAQTPPSTPTPQPGPSPTPSTPPSATPSPTPQQQPTTGDTTDLPSTGPAEVMGVFAATTLAGYIVHRVLRRAYLI